MHDLVWLRGQRVVGKFVVLAEGFGGHFEEALEGLEVLLVRGGCDGLCNAMIPGDESRVDGAHRGPPAGIVASFARERSPPVRRLGLEGRRLVEESARSRVRTRVFEEKIAQAPEGQREVSPVGRHRVE